MNQWEKSNKIKENELKRYVFFLGGDRKEKERERKRKRESINFNLEPEFDEWLIALEWEEPKVRDEEGCESVCEREREKKKMSHGCHGLDRNELHFFYWKFIGKREIKKYKN